ncbi:hypothetical protein CHH91_02380 [Virgibacillus sp. 7505]|nr:hypothetical protein CHH91_02380 [Virgibacillus sp. 7505]
MVNNIKNLDVRDIQQQVDSTKDFISKTKESVEQVKQALNGITTLHDGFAGNTADSIRSFYEEAHKPFLEFMESFLVQYEEALSTVNEQVLSFEPNESGFIRQEFLEGELTSKMQKAQDSLSATTDAINQQLNSVSDLASVSHVKDDVFLDSITDAKKRITKTIDNMYEMDSNATSKLDNSQDDIQQMKTYVSKLRNAIDKNSITVGNYSSDQLTKQEFYKDFLLSTKGKKAQTSNTPVPITRDEFEALREHFKDSKNVEDDRFEWNGEYITLNDGRIIRAYQDTTSLQMAFEFVSHIPDKREDLKEYKQEEGKQIAVDAYNFLIGDDLRTLTDPNASLGAFSMAALSMAGPGKVIKGYKLLRTTGKSFKKLDDGGIPATKAKTKIETNQNAIIANKFPDESLPSNGKLLNYTIEDGAIKGLNGQRHLDFIIDAENNLVIGKKHHFLGNAQDVKAAGQLKLNGQGKVRRIDNLSGHYRPTVNEGMNYPDLFKQNNLNINNSWLELYEIKIDEDGFVESIDKSVSRKLK